MVSSTQVIALSLVLVLLTTLLVFRPYVGASTTDPASSCAANKFAISESAGVLTCGALVVGTAAGFCKLTGQTATVNCFSFTSPSGQTSIYVVPCYVTATGLVNHGTCQVSYTEANTNAAITLTLVTATNLNTVYTAEDVIWVAASTTVTESLQVTAGTFNVGGSAILEA